MPMGAVTLRPGVNTQKTLSVNEAGVGFSQLIRYDGGIIQTYGGWTGFNGAAINSTIRDLHAWKGLSTTKYLGIGATQSLSVYNSATATIQDITPQTNTSNPTPNFSIGAGSCTVTVVDGGSSATVYDTVFFNTPIALGSILLNGAYKIQSVLGTSIYTIFASESSSTAVASSGILPIFTTSSGNPVIVTRLPNNNFQKITGLFYDFIAPTAVGGLTVQGPYQISSIIDSTDFTITAVVQATSAATVTMNNGSAQLKYYITLGPQSSATGFGAGGFGLGGFGTGTSVTGGTGTPITATDWTSDNWGEVYLACPRDGAIYSWSPTSGFVNAQVITQAPFFNGGIFVSMPQQILVAWKSCQETGVQDPLMVRWSDSEDYTNWEISNQTSAGSFRIPNGSEILAGIQGPTQGLIWTDTDIWSMQYVGGDAIFGFNKIGAGAGILGAHAAGTLSGEVFWIGRSSFYRLTGGGVQVIPCEVWDFIFQNINTAQLSKVVCATNSMFNEVVWFFPSINATENDSYVKFDIQEGVWDYGSLIRTAWVDASVLGNPIGADTTGTLYYQENGTSITGTGMPAFQTGWWAIAEGNEMSFVDYIIPDFIWGTWASARDAEVKLTFYAVDYPGDTYRSYGPYTVTSATQYITPRIRGRLMSVLVQSQSQSFWRIGKIRFRYAAMGRR